MISQYIFSFYRLYLEIFKSNTTQNTTRITCFPGSRKSVLLRPEQKSLAYLSWRVDILGEG